MTSRLTVSVIIPTYNRAHCVGEAIDSVLAQDPPADEVIVVDDGSTDTTLEVLAEYDKRITVLQQKNAGAAAARNAGIRHATSEWVAFLDSDDLWCPGRIAALHRDLSAAEDDIIGHTGDMRLTGEGYNLRVFNLRNWQFPQDSAERIESPLTQAMTGIHPPATALRRDSILQEGGFHETMRIYEDAPLFCGLALKGPWLFTGSVLAEARRLQSDVSALSGIERNHPVEAATARVTYIKDFLDRKLTPDLRQLVERRTSGALLILAAAEAEENTGSHRRTAIASARQHPSALKGWLKALPPLLLGRKGYNISLRRHKAFTRS